MWWKRCLERSSRLTPGAEILWPAVKLTDIGEQSLRETADYVGVLGKTHSGAVFTADISGGVTPENARFSFDIRGSEGWLSLTGGHPYGVQAGDLKLTSNVEFVPPEKPAVSGGLLGAAINVGEIYAQSCPRSACGHLQHTRL